MKNTHDYWFSGMAGLVGIVVGEDESTGEGKAYIGVAPGLDQVADAKFVAEMGAKLTLRTLDEIRGHLAPKKKPVPAEAVISKAKFKLRDVVKVVQILDTMTSKDLIGFVGTIREIDPLPNGEFNYYVDTHYMHEAEIEKVGGAPAADAPAEGEDHE